MEREIRPAQDAIAAATGRAPRLFRAPVGIRNPWLDRVLARTGLRLVSWTRRGLDTVRADAARIAARLLRGLAAGDILLLHDGSSARDGAGRAVAPEPSTACSTGWPPPACARCPRRRARTPPDQALRAAGRGRPARLLLVDSAAGGRAVAHGLLPRGRAWRGATSSSSSPAAATAPRTSSGAASSPPRGRRASRGRPGRGRTPRLLPQARRRRSPVGRRRPAGSRPWLSAPVVRGHLARRPRRAPAGPEPSGRPRRPLRPRALPRRGRPRAGDRAGGRPGALDGARSEHDFRGLWGWLRGYAAGSRGPASGSPTANPTATRTATACSPPRCPRTTSSSTAGRARLDGLDRLWRVPRPRRLPGHHPRRIARPR